MKIFSLPTIHEKKANAILLFDNELLIALDFSYSLCCEGHHVEGVVYSAQTLLSIISQGEIDILIINLEYSNSKIDLSTLIKTSQHYNLQIIFVTSHLTYNSKERLANLGFNYLLEKPISSQQLIQAVNHISKS